MGCLPGGRLRTLNFMACRISELVLNCADPELLARFWSEVLGYVELDREDGAVEIGPPDAGFGGLQPTIILSLHIDVNPVDRQTPSSNGCSPSALPPTSQPATSSGTSWPRGQRVLPPAHDLRTCRYRRLHRTGSVARTDPRGMLSPSRTTRGILYDG
jgi:hypothetical protein